jgi:hypothetical protein
LPDGARRPIARVSRSSRGSHPDYFTTSRTSIEMILRLDRVWTEVRAVTDRTVTRRLYSRRTRIGVRTWAATTPPPVHVGPTKAPGHNSTNEGATRNGRRLSLGGVLLDRLRKRRQREPPSAGARRGSNFGRRQRGARRQRGPIRLRNADRSPSPDRDRVRRRRRLWPGRGLAANLAPAVVSSRVNASVPGMIYLVLGYGAPGGLYESTDRGMNWDQLSISPWDPSTMPLTPQALGVSPSSDQAMALSFHDDCTSTCNALCFGITTNAGASWTAINGPTLGISGWQEALRRDRERHLPEHRHVAWNPMDAAREFAQCGLFDRRRHLPLRERHMGRKRAVRQWRRAGLLASAARRSHVVDADALSRFAARLL